MSAYNTSHTTVNIHSFILSFFQSFTRPAIVEQMRKGANEDVGISRVSIVLVSAVREGLEPLSQKGGGIEEGGTVKGGDRVDCWLCGRRSSCGENKQEA